MSIKRVIFTSGQNLKPPFLCQCLIFFNDFFFIRHFIWIITLTEKSKFEENCQSEGILYENGSKIALTEIQLVVKDLNKRILP